MQPDLTIATWNAGWISRHSRKFERAVGRINDLDADVLVLTEATLDLIPDHGHHALGGQDWGYRDRANRRKVVLWAKRPITEIRDGLIDPPGRHIEAMVQTPPGPVRVHAVCVPWRDAHVRSGRQDARPWSEHLKYPDYLGRLLIAEATDTGDDGPPLVVAGDMNQRTGKYPYGNEETWQAWAELCRRAGLEVATLESIIDKIALGRRLLPGEVTTLSRDGISDHHAVRCEVSFG